MGKITLYFDTKEQMDAYFTEGVPSNVLAIVRNGGGVYTTSNNDSSSGNAPEQQGGEPITDEDRECIQNILEG